MVSLMRMALVRAQLSEVRTCTTVGRALRGAARGTDDTGRVCTQLRGGIKLSIIAPSGARVPAARVEAEPELVPRSRKNKNKERGQEEQGGGTVVEVAELDCTEGIAECGVYLVQVCLMRDAYVSQA